MKSRNCMKGMYNLQKWKHFPLKVNLMRETNDSTFPETPTVFDIVRSTWFSEDSPFFDYARLTIGSWETCRLWIGQWEVCWEVLAEG